MCAWPQVPVPPCAQMGGGWCAPFLFPCRPCLHVTPVCRLGGGGASGCTQPRVPMPPLHTNKEWVACSPPIPVWTPFTCHPSMWARGRGRFQVCAALGSCAPLAHKWGAGGAPPSYSRADPICMSPQHVGQGEGVLLPGLRMVLSLCFTFACKAQKGNGAPLPIPTLPPVCVSPLH